MMARDFERMLFCEVCDAPACVGSNITFEGLAMADVGNWRCEEHHPHRQASYTREQWAEARATGKLYPEPAQIVREAAE